MKPSWGRFHPQRSFLRRCSERLRAAPGTTVHRRCDRTFSCRMPCRSSWTASRGACPWHRVLSEWSVLTHDQVSFLRHASSLPSSTNARDTIKYVHTQTFHRIYSDVEDTCLDVLTSSTPESKIRISCPKSAVALIAVPYRYPITT